MTDKQRQRIHDIEYSCDSREELAERIVGLEDKLAKLERQAGEFAKAAWGCVNRHVSCNECRIVYCGCTLQSAMRELGIEVDA